MFFGSHFVCQNLFRLSIRTSMQNLDSVAQEMSELCSILRFGGHFFSKFVRTIHTNFHAKFGLCSSRNERVMHNFAIWRPFCFLKFLSKLVQTVHTNFHGHLLIYHHLSSSDYTVKTFLFKVRKFGQ